MKRRYIFTAVIVLAFMSVFPSHTFAQITITSTDFLNLIGSREVVLGERNFSTTVDVGSPGANQIWDFRNMVIGDTIVTVFEFLSPEQTVSASTFPEANFVETFSTPEEPGFEGFQFYNFTNNDFISLGDSTRFSSMGLDTSLVFFQNDTLAPLPIAFGNTWMTFERDTTGFFPLTANISIDTSTTTVDGWGTIRLPLGDFECLRLKQEGKLINQSIINGSIFSTNTETFIAYDWIGRNSFQLAHVQSQDGETNPNFTDARGFGVLDTTTASAPTSVEGITLIPSAFELSQNYPNPFNPETVIRYELLKNTRVELAIYNLMGQRIRVLVSENQSTGSYQTMWNGTDDAGLPVSSGVYLYELRAGDIRQSKKMVLLQ